MEFYDTSQITEHLARESFAASLLRRAPRGGTPIFAMTGLAKPKSITSIGDTYWTKSAEHTSFNLTTAIASAGTTTLVAAAEDVARVIPNMILRYQDPTAPATLEHMLVTAKPTSTTLTVVRGFGGTTAQASIPTTALLVDVGNAFEQGSAAPSPRSIGLSLVTNYTQIFRNAWGNAKTLSAVAVEVGEGNLAENKRDCMFFHAQAIENAILFGTKSPATLGAAAPTLNGRPVTTMDGIENSIRNVAPSNIFAAGATTTMDQLESYLEPTLDFTSDVSGSMEKFIYTGSTGLKVINDLGKADSQQTSTVETNIFGQQFRTFRTTRGTFNVMEHPMLNFNPIWAKTAFVMDFSAFDLMYLRKTTTEPIRGTGKDEDAGVMTTELTLRFQNPFACAVIHNLTAAA